MPKIKPAKPAVHPITQAKQAIFDKMGTLHCGAGPGCTACQHRRELLEAFQKLVYSAAYKAGYEAGMHDSHLRPGDGMMGG